MKREETLTNMVIGKRARLWSRVQPEHVLAILRIALGVIFVIGGLKLVVPSLFNVADTDALAAQFTDPATGYISPLFATKITDTLGLSIGAFLQIQGMMEIALGMLLMVGAFTPMVAVQMGLMLWAFTVASPVVGPIRLSRDLALMGLCFALALSGADAWSFDGKFRSIPFKFLERKDIVLLILRLSLAYPLLVSALFAGGVFDNPLNTTLPVVLVLILGVLLTAGVIPRWAMGFLLLWMVYLLPVNLVAHGVFPGLDEVKREIGIMAAALIYIFAGPDRWAWPRPMHLRCRTVVDLILAYLEDTLPRRDRRAFEAHIADCTKCWRFLKTYRQTLELGQELREDRIPPEVHKRLESFLRDRLSRPS